MGDKMFEKLIFANDTEKGDFEKYKRIKGVYLYKQVYDILLEANGNDGVNYSEVSSFIRYDKNLRDKLYIYLATAEEYLRALLCDKYDVDINFKKNTNLSSALLPKDKELDHSNLYFKLNIDFSALMDICINKKLIDIDQRAKTRIKELRNCTMHHAMLLFGKTQRLSALEEHFLALERKINDFVQVIPEEYRGVFYTSIKKLNGYPDKQYLTKFYLEVDDGTREIRIKR